MKPIDIVIIAIVLTALVGLLGCAVPVGAEEFAIKDAPDNCRWADGTPIDFGKCRLAEPPYSYDLTGRTYITKGSLADPPGVQISQETAAYYLAESVCLAKREAAMKAMEPFLYQLYKQHYSYDEMPFKFINTLQKAIVLWDDAQRECRNPE